MAKNIRIDITVLQSFVSQYKSSFAEHRLGTDNEIYKWKAIKCFQDNWDIDAVDFLSMVRASFAQTYNLLASQNNFPERMIEEFTKVAPDEVRAMFRELFDESIDLARRASSFEKRAADLCKLNPSIWKSHYQTPNAISTYLWLCYPDKYYTYKYSVIKDTAKKLCGVDLPTGKYERMLFGFDLYNAIRKELVKDHDLATLSRNSLTSDCYPDEQLVTLTVDLVYFISKHDASTPQSSPLQSSDMTKNIILYGTPGTGKTYSAALYAVSIIEEKPLEAIVAEGYSVVFDRYKKYKDEGLIAFTTFHQSFGYEEFIEGIRPVVTDIEKTDGGKTIEYEIRDGIFKAFCDRAGTPLPGEGNVDLGIGTSPTVWKISLEGTGDNLTRKECMENSHIRIGWEEYGDSIPDDNDYSTHGGRFVLNAFYNGMQIGDIVMSCYSNKTIDAIGVITGDVEWCDQYPIYKRLRKVRWLVKGINEDIVGLNAGKTMTSASVYKLSVSASDVIRILQRTNPHLFTSTVKIPNRVFIIDEINRGNISKIFGELITLIEPTKRVGATEELRALLPYSGQNFGVPGNVYIIGTMNTADRSIAMLDTALRRRFDFVEMKPDSDLLRDVVVDGIDVAEMLDTLNNRITVLLDREHTIGHSFLLPLKQNSTIERMAEIFERKIIPLLQEYFYDDYEKIGLVLGDNQKSDDSVRFVVKKSDAVKLFGNADIDYPDFYEINPEAFKRIEAYAFLN